MSTENKLKEVLKRVEYGMSGLTESDWLYMYFETLHAIIKDQARQIKDARDKVLVDPDWRFGDDDTER